MSLDDNQIERLDSLKLIYKFTDEDWDNRGLIPSSKQISDKMDNLVNKCLNDLIETKEYEITEKDYIKILDKGLSRFRKIEYDTEEQEFIVDIFHKIAEIIDLEYNESLNKWLYGRLISYLDKADSNKDLTEISITDNANINGYWTMCSYSAADSHIQFNVCPKITFNENGQGFIKKSSIRIEPFNWSLKKGILTIKNTGYFPNSTFLDGNYPIGLIEKNDGFELVMHQQENDIRYFLLKSVE